MLQETLNWKTLDLSQFECNFVTSSSRNTAPSVYKERDVTQIVTPTKLTENVVACVVYLCVLHHKFCCALLRSKPQRPDVLYDLTRTFCCWRNKTYTPTKVIPIFRWNLIRNNLRTYKVLLYIVKEYFRKIPREIIVKKFSLLIRIVTVIQKRKNDCVRII